MTPESGQRIGEVIAHGTYRQCPTCRVAAPIIGGIPADGSLTVSRGRFEEGGRIHPLTFTPHHANCPEAA